MNCFEGFLKRNDGNDGGDYLIAIHHRSRDRQTHLLAGSNYLRAADDDATPVHARENFAHALIDFFFANDVGLKRAMNLTFDGTNCQRDQIRILLKRSLQTDV